MTDPAPPVSGGPVLRPVTEADLPRLEVSPEQRDDEWNFFGFSADGWLRKAFLDRTLLGNDHGTLVVDVGGEAVGEVSWHAVWYAPRSTPPAFNIGAFLLPAHRGRGYGSVAQRALADYLFATYPVARIEAHTDVRNLAEQKALTKAGFEREGVLRAAQWRGGRWNDMVAYAVIRADRTTRP